MRNEYYALLERPVDYWRMTTSLSFSQGFKQGVEVMRKLYDQQTATPDRPEAEQCNLSIDDAKAIIKNFFNLRHGEVFDYIDIASETELPLASIVAACQALEREGKIAAVD